MAPTRRTNVILTGTVAAAIVLPLAIVGWLYLAQTREGTPAVVVRCDPQEATRGTPILELTAEQCRTIGERIAVKPATGADAESRPSNVSALDHRLPVDIGDAPPQDATLAPLPDEVTSAHPSLAGYRYYLSEDEIALVEPDARRVVALVEVHVGRPQ